MSIDECCKLVSLRELLKLHELPDGTSKHLLILYSLVIGTNAKLILELGLGRTTGALRAAAARTGGVVNTCDFDKRRLGHLVSQQDEAWRLFLEPSGDFLGRFPGPVDFVLHDGAHDYEHVKGDLQAILPKMRQFGLVCVHDTQQPDLYRDMLGAIRDVVAQHSVSLVNLPFSCGLAIIRVEQSIFPPVQPTAGTLPDGRSDTLMTPFPMAVVSHPAAADIGQSGLATRFRAFKITVGHHLRQWGLR